MRPMSGRVIQSSGPLRYAIVDGMNVRDSRMHNDPPRCGARWRCARQKRAASGTASDSEEAGRSSARQKKGWVKSAFGSKSHLRRSDKPADPWLALNPPKAAH
jgi:hypothetical protein